MNKDIYGAIDVLNNLYEDYYNDLKPLVINLINNNITDINLIENYLDSLLNIPLTKAYLLFKKLCEYYK